jgi:hypothetical protein
MRIRLPEKFTVVVSPDGRLCDQSQACRLPDPHIALILNDMGLKHSIGAYKAQPWIFSGYQDPARYDDVWVYGPDEEVALFKLKYL